MGQTRASAAHNIADYFRSIVTTFVTMFYWIGRPLEDVRICSRMVAIIEPVVAIILVPLFLLALRRKFRR